MVQDGGIRSLVSQMEKGTQGNIPTIPEAAIRCFPLHLNGQNLVKWPHLAATEAWKWNFHPEHLYAQPKVGSSIIVQKQQ